MFKKAEQENQHTIKTERLELVPLSPRFAKEMLKLWGDADVICYMNLRMFVKASACRTRIKNLQAANIKKGCPNHFVLLLDGEVIGLAGFPAVEQNGLADGSAWGFYYQIVKKYWGCGFGTEATKTILAYIFVQYPGAVVYADSVADNLASVAILKKLGFELTHVDEKAFTKNGMEQDILHFRLLAKH